MQKITLKTNDKFNHKGVTLIESLASCESEDLVSSPILGHSKIPVASKTTTKVKTIKKHSKPIRDITKSIPRPQIGNIEWDFNEDNQIQESTKQESTIQFDEYEFNISDEQFPSQAESDSDSEGKGSPPSIHDTKQKPVKSDTGADLSGSASESGSDIALHEAGAELSDDEPGNYQEHRYLYY